MLKSLVRIAIILICTPCTEASQKIPNQTEPHFRQIEKFDLGGEGFWDYLTVDPKARRLYISRSTRVMVINLDSGKLIQELTGTDGVHGIALDPEDDLGFTSNGHSGTVSIFDLKTLLPIGQVPVGNNPDAILYDAMSKRVFVFNGASHDVSVIDARKKEIVGQIALTSKPEFAVSAGNGQIFVNLEIEDSIALINSISLKEERKLSVKPCHEPTGLAVDPVTRRLFVGCKNRLMVVLDADLGKVIRKFDVGANVDAVAFDSKRKLIFVSAGDGTMTIVKEESPSQFKLLETVLTQKGSRTVAVDPESGRAFLAAAKFGPASKMRDRKPPILPGSFSILVFGQR